MTSTMSLRATLSPYQQQKGNLFAPSIITITSSSSARHINISHHHRCRRVVVSASSQTTLQTTATPTRAVVVLPGLGNNAADYEALAAQLRSDHSLLVEIAPVARIDWARNAAGLLDKAYWVGTLKPRPTVDWYLDRIITAVSAVKTAAPPNTPITLLAHSAGGWLGRLYMLEEDLKDAQIDRFVSLGSPHLAPPEGVIDQTRGILTWISQNCPGSFHDEIEYVTIAGKYIQGAPLRGPGGWSQRVVGAGYQQVCGAADVWGDGVVPVAAAHLEGALQITLEGVYHSPLGAEEGSDDSSSSSEVGAALAAGNLESSSNSTMTDLDAYNDDDVSLKEVEEAAAAAVASGPGPRLWYGSKSVLQQWVRFIHSSS